MMKSDFELLAPAGSYEILKAVIEAGADAVYVGGSRFGARAYANNFTEEELLDAIDYVHLRGKKLYLTVNTLFKNEEMQEELYEYLLPYYLRGLDAVIVQDIGLITFIKQNFPELPIHTSTQMTITGAEGAKLLKNLGAERVVLARELSISEMAHIRKEADVEFEAFVHGALCYSYSGQCLFSSMLGGRSGNRGRCAQPCRLPYTVLDKNQKVCKKESYVLSLKDLCGIEYLQQLRQAGVYSLKIEGRMKQASYAAGVVSYYRKYIDLEQQVTEEDMQHLYELGNRCGFTTTYFDKHNGADMITFDKPSYEKSNEALHQDIENRYVNKKSQLPISGTLVLRQEEESSLYVYTEDGITSYATAGLVMEAKNKPLDQDDVRMRICKTGDTQFYFKDIEIQMDDNIFVPNGVLNQLRRDALNQLQNQLLQTYQRKEKMKEDITSDAKNTNSHDKSSVCYIATCETREQVDKCLACNELSTIYVDSMIFEKESFISDLKDCVERTQKDGKTVFLRLPAIFRTETSGFFVGITEALKKIPLDGFVIRNYEQMHYISTSFPHSIIVADHNLYSYNDYAKRLLEKLGVSYTTVPLELNQKEIRGRDNHNSEMVVYGYYPLMTTAGCVHKNTSGCDRTSAVMYLKDRYQVLFPVKNVCGACYNVIYNSLPTILLGEIDKLSSIGIHRFRLDFTVESADETEKVLQMLSGEKTEIVSTKGHYKRGVE